MPSNFFGSNLPPQVTSSQTASARSLNRATMRTGCNATIDQSNFASSAMPSVVENSDYWLQALATASSNVYGTVTSADDIMKVVDVSTGDNGTDHSSVNRAVKDYTYNVVWQFSHASVGASQVNANYVIGLDGLFRTDVGVISSHAAIATTVGMVSNTWATDLTASQNYNARYGGGIYSA